MTLPDMVKRIMNLEAEIKRLEVLESPVPVAGGGAITFIQKQDVTVATRPITFDNIPGTYRHLLFVGSVRTAIAGEDDTGLFHVNNIGLNNAAFYSYYSRYSGAVKVPLSGAVANQLMFASQINGSTSTPADTFTPFTLWCFFYARTERNRQFGGQWAFGKDSSAPDIEAVEGECSSHWINTANAITRVDFDTWAGASNFVAGSTISLFGIG